QPPRRTAAFPANLLPPTQCRAHCADDPYLSVSAHKRCVRRVHVVHSGESAPEGGGEASPRSSARSLSPTLRYRGHPAQITQHEGRGVDPALAISGANPDRTYSTTVSNDSLVVVRVS